MTRRFESRRGLAQMLVTVALASTVVYGVFAASIGRPVILRDAFAYNKTAMRLLNTGVFEYGDGSIDSAVPSAFTMPGYTLFVSGVYAVVPRSNDVIESILIAQPAIIVAQLMLAVCAALLICLAGYRLGGRAIGWTSGALAVAYVPFGMNATVTMTETLALVLMSGVTLSTVELFRLKVSNPRKSLLWAAAFGLLGGLSILVRPTIAMWLLLPLAVWLYANRAHLRQAWLTIGASVVCVALVMLPWVVRNAAALGEFVPLNDSVSTPLIDSVGGAVFSEEEEQLMARVEAENGDGVRAVALSRLRTRWDASPREFLSWKAAYLWKGISNVTHLPGDILNEVQVYGQPPEGSYADAGRFTLRSSMPFHLKLYDVLNWYQRLLLVLACGGVLLGRRRKIIWVLASIPVYYAVLHTAVLFMVRYFYPAMPALIVLAAFGLCGGARVATSAWHSRAGVDADRGYSPVN